MACGGSPTKRADITPEKNIQSVEETSVQTLTRLEQIAEQYTNSDDYIGRNLALLGLADEYAQNDDCDSANIIISHLQRSIENVENIENSTSTYHQSYQNIIKAECELYKLNRVSMLANKQPVLDMISKWLEQTRFLADNALLSNQLPVQKIQHLKQRKQVANAQLLGQSEQYFSALDSLMQTDNSQQYLTQSNMNNLVWSWLSKIEQSKRATLAQRYPILQSYQTILSTIEDRTINDRIRQNTINQWLSTSAPATIAENLPTQVQAYLSSSNDQKQNIAVLLPLSGRLSAQGEAIKQGLLSAYYTRLTQSNTGAEETTIHFIDTGSLNNIDNDITTERLADYDTIIGPLLRSHIVQLQSIDLSDKKQLLLNQVDNSEQQTSSQHAAFSLSVEQEAEQLVSIMRSRNISNPVLVSDGSNTTERMVNAFKQGWQETQLKDTQNQKLQHIRYTNNKSMRVGITSALDVLQSEKRIKQISNLTQERVISVTRNRRDIDAFVVFARPDDVELINPIIESSISLFSNEQVPVFATSYSYNHKQNKNSQRDLRNLVFIDMPWLLPQGRNRELAREVDQLFNQPPSQFLRLFAFGFDSFALINNLVQLRTFDHLFVDGLSGKLSINSDLSMHRDLQWMAITQAETQ